MPSSTALRSLGACIARCDLDVGELVSAPMASGLATLVADERELGATVIDMGGGTTGMAVFAEGQLLHTAQLPIGGLHVTNDLARMLSTPVAHAERLKTLYGNAQPCKDDESEMLPVPLVGEEEHQIAKVPRSMVVNIIRPRLEETFEMVKERLDSSGLTRAAGTRVVLTGGACQLAGARESGRPDSQQAGAPRPTERTAWSAGLRRSGPAFATAAGLLAWAAGEGRTMRDVDLEVERPTGLHPSHRQFFAGARLMPEFFAVRALGTTRIEVCGVTTAATNRLTTRGRSRYDSESHHSADSAHRLQPEASP